MPADFASVPFALSSYRSKTRKISGQQLVNCYAQAQDSRLDPRFPIPLLGTPGMVQFATAGAGPIRALIEVNDIAYGVSGSQLYRINENQTADALGGGIAPGSNVLGIGSNGTEILVVDGTSGFVYNTNTAAYAPVTDTDFRPARTVSFINTYLMLEALGTNEFFSSDSDNALAYDPLFFDAAATNPDQLLAVLAHHQQLYLPGKKGIEIWQFNQNTSGFPWFRPPGGNIQTGTAGAFAQCTHNEKFYFVGANAKFYRLDGDQPIEKQHPGIAEIWSRYGDISDVVTWGITFEDEEWIVITFPSVPATWVFSEKTELFHELESHDTDMVSLGRWRGNVYCKAYGRHLIGDAFTNKIGYLDAETYTELGNPIRFRAVSPTLHNDGNRVHLSSLELIMATGVGTTNGQGSSPKCILDWSNDDGESWSIETMEGDLGGVGERTKLVRFTGMGSFDQECYRITITDPVKRAIMSAVPKAKGGLKYG